MPRILAVADEVAEALYGGRLAEITPDLIVSCGDLPFDYLEYLVTMASVPLLYVPGNHDPEVRAPVGAGIVSGGLPEPVGGLAGDFRPPPGPGGGVNVDGTIERASGLVLAGLGGSVRYAEGPNRYTQGQMWWRALRLELRARLRGVRGRLSVLLTHTPPLGVGDVEDDPAHAGFAAFHRLVRTLRPTVLVHGHVHPYGPRGPDRRLWDTLVVNAVPYRVLDLDPSGRLDVHPEGMP